MSSSSSGPSTSDSTISVDVACAGPALLMLEIAALGSGSSGNAVLVRGGDTLLLVDCGFTLKEATARMACLGVTPADLDAVLVTHEHGDHLKGVGPLSRKYHVPVWTTHGTYRSARDRRFPEVKLFHAHEQFTIGTVDVDPFPTPHDAAESCQFVFSRQGVRFACLTDLGACTPHVKAKLVGVHGLVIECNYDTVMLQNGPYPASLQSRIRSNYGHLGNEQAGVLLSELDHDALQCILLGHLSEQNNADAVALETIRGHLSSGLERVHVLQQHRCSEWFAVAHSVTDSDAGTEVDVDAAVDANAPDTAQAAHA